MKKFISGIVIGAIFFSTTQVIASTYQAAKNKFPIKVNGTLKNVDAYNINGRTYIQLNDIAQYTDLEVAFKNNTIYISDDDDISDDFDDEEDKTNVLNAGYESVPSFEKTQKVSPKKVERKSKYDKIEMEFETKDAVKLAKNYITNLESAGFTKVNNIDDDLDFENDDDGDDDDLVFKKGNIYVSVEYDDDDVKIRMATYK